MNALSLSLPPEHRFVPGDCVVCIHPGHESFGQTFVVYSEAFLCLQAGQAPIKIALYTLDGVRTFLFADDGSRCYKGMVAHALCEKSRMVRVHTSTGAGTYEKGWTRNFDPIPALFMRNVQDPDTVQEGSKEKINEMG